MIPPPRSSQKTWLTVTAIYLVVTAAYAWPLVRHLGTVFPHDPGDPALTTWMVWWNAQAVPLTERWWNAPIFYPLKGAFALSETLLAMAPVTTPLQWMGASGVTAHNVAFLLSFPLSALAAHALAYRLTGRHDAALLAGLVGAFNPNRASQLPHIQVLWSMWMPAALLACHRYLDTHKRRYLVYAGLAWVLNATSSGYFLVFFGVLMAFWLLWFPRTFRERVAIATTFGLATLIVLPIFLGHHRYQAALGLSRGLEEIEAFSADLTAYWAVSSAAWLPNHWSAVPHAEGEFYPGIAILVLAIAGAVVAWGRAKVRPATRVQAVLAIGGVALGVAALAAFAFGGWRTVILGLEISLTRPGKALFTAVLLLAAAAALDDRARAAWRNRSPQVFYVFGVIAMMLFSLGPVGRVDGVKFLYEAPYSWLMHLPGAAGMRVPARFGILAIICLAQAGAIGYARLARRGPSYALAGVLSVLVLADGWIPTFPTVPVPTVVGVKPGGDTSVPVVELPMTDPFNDLSAIVRAMGHGHPVVNGFSGYAPAHYQPLMEAFATGDPAAFESLTRLGPLLVVIDRSRDPDDEGAQYVASVPGAELLYPSPLGPVFRLPATPVPAPSRTDPELSIASADANQNFPGISSMIDRNLNTWWQTQEFQSGGDQIAIAFDRPVRLSRIELDLGTSTADYPRRLRIETAGDDEPPALVWEGRTAPLAMLGAFEDYLRAPVRIDLPGSVVASRFTLTAMERSKERRWSVAEIHAFGRQAD